MVLSVDGVKHGMEQYWLDDGTLCWETPYKQGLVHGVEREWCGNTLWNETL